MSKKVLKIAYFLICTIIILTKESYGYLDPSAMTYIIQIIASVGITIATSVGIFFYKIKKVFKKRKQADAEEEDDE